jgi:hypothetical protein
MATLDDREKEIQKLCKDVLENAAVWEPYPNSYDRYRCVFCNAEIRDTYNPITLQHEVGCAFLIAKSLSTNLIDNSK